jgi:hypothetical protein
VGPEDAGENCLAQSITSQTLSDWQILAGGKKIFEKKLNFIWWNEIIFISLYRTINKYNL